MKNKPAFVYPKKISVSIEDLMALKESVVKIDYANGREVLEREKEKALVILIKLLEV